MVRGWRPAWELGCQSSHSPETETRLQSGLEKGLRLMTATARSAWIPARETWAGEGMIRELGLAMCALRPGLQAPSPSSRQTRGSRPPAPPPSDPGVRYLRVERVIIVCVLVVVTGVQQGE